MLTVNIGLKRLRLPLRCYKPDTSEVEFYQNVKMLAASNSQPSVEAEAAIDPSDTSVLAWTRLAACGTVVPIASALKTNRTLTSLDLGANTTHYDQGQRTGFPAHPLVLADLSAIGEALRTNDALVELSLVGLPVRTPSPKSHFHIHFARVTLVALVALIALVTVVAFALPSPSF